MNRYNSVLGIDRLDQSFQSVKPEKKIRSQATQIKGLKEELKVANLKIKEEKIISAQKTANIRCEYAKQRESFDELALHVRRLEQDNKAQQDNFKVKFDEQEKVNFTLKEKNHRLKEELNLQQKKIDSDQARIIALNAVIEELKGQLVSKTVEAERAQ